MVRSAANATSVLHTKIVRQPPYRTAREAVQHKHIWLSGGLGGFGVEFCKELLRLGCSSLAVVDILEPEAGKAKVSTFVNKSCQDVYYMQVDVRDKSAVRNSLNEVVNKFGRLDIVINNAGVAGEANAEWVIGVNLMAIMTATEAALDIWEHADGKDKTIVNVSSAGGLFPMPFAPVYAASKFGVVGYTKSMRNACWERGVRINCFCPGWAEIGMGKTMSKIGDTSNSTGVLTRDAVVEGFVELLRRRDVVGEAIYVSQSLGMRVAGINLETKLGEINRAKL